MASESTSVVITRGEGGGAKSEHTHTKKSPECIKNVSSTLKQDRAREEHPFGDIAVHIANSWRGQRISLYGRSTRCNSTMKRILIWCRQDMHTAASMNVNFIVVGRDQTGEIIWLESCCIKCRSRGAAAWGWRCITRWQQENKGEIERDRREAGSRPSTKIAWLCLGWALWLAGCVTNALKKHVKKLESETGVKSL